MAAAVIARAAMLKVISFMSKFLAWPVTGRQLIILIWQCQSAVGHPGPASESNRHCSG
jgi:predicted tellurium resistance membrane protein TerC